MEEVIPNLVTEQTNKLMTMLPSKGEIYNAIFGLKRDSVDSLYGLGPIFYQNYWKIIKEDVIRAIMQFFTEGWITSNYNSNIVVLIPKTEEDERINQYRPIALANFKLKIITKVLAYRLARVLPHIISKDHKGFIHGKNIKDSIFLTSEVANIIHKKPLGGN